MITLQQLLMTDSDPSGGTLTGKGAEGAQDFLSLLAGALTETTGKGKDAPLTLADPSLLNVVWAVFSSSDKLTREAKVRS